MSKRHRALKRGRYRWLHGEPTMRDIWNGIYKNKFLHPKLTTWEDAYFWISERIRRSEDRPSFVWMPNFETYWRPLFAACAAHEVISDFWNKDEDGEAIAWSEPFNVRIVQGTVVGYGFSNAAAP